MKRRRTPWCYRSRDETTMEKEPGDVTQLLLGLKSGDPAAESQLLEVVYGELRGIAGRMMRRERQDHTLQATALIHEAYVHLVDQRGKDWQNRAHFFGVSAQVMRRILVDHARTRRTKKRGGGQPKVSLDEALPLSIEQSDEVLALDEALSRLAQFDPRQSRVVELRFFGGLTDEEAAEVLGVSSRTVKRDWVVAKAWLYGELNK
jgi:RNA polymerase sigma factor (TIGR02999 family)